MRRNSRTSRNEEKISMKRNAILTKKKKKEKMSELEEKKGNARITRN